MISGIRGKLVDIDEQHAEIDTGAFTVSVFVPSGMFVENCKIGSEIYLYTYMTVKDEEVNLYGFKTREEQKLFRLLITVSGIGPKGALSILSYLTPEKLILAIVSKDVKAISKAQGIGAKTAEKACIELRDKVTKPEFSGVESEIGSTDVSAGINPVKRDVILALTELGFSESEAFKAVSGLSDELNESMLLNQALKTIGR